MVIHSAVKDEVHEGHMYKSIIWPIIDFDSMPDCINNDICLIMQIFMAHPQTNTLLSVEMKA